jgi:hypothetical protein
MLLIGRQVPLQLPSFFVLQLAPGATITPAANLTLKNTSTFTGLVSMWDVHFSAVVGGAYDHRLGAGQNLQACILHEAVSRPG